MPFSIAEHAVVSFFTFKSDFVASGKSRAEHSIACHDVICHLSQKLNYILLKA